MPEKLSIPEFAARIKAKYPDYRTIDDHELVEKVLEKYPEYEDQVDTRGGFTKLVDVAVPTALRVGGAIGGAALGGGATFGLGTVVGGAAGGALGETLAEGYEKARGIRKEINPAQIATQTVLSGIPGSRAANLGRRVLQNAALGAVGSAATEVAEGENPNPKNMLISALVGGGLGAVAKPSAEGESLAQRVRAGLTDEGVERTHKSLERLPKVEEGVRAHAGKLEQEDILGKKGGTIFGNPTTPIPPQGKMSEAQKLGPESFSAEGGKRVGIQLKSFPEPVRQPLREILEQHNGFEQQRRGVQSWERTQALSQRISVDLENTLPKGKLLRAEEQGAYSNALASITDQLRELAAKDPSTLTDADRLNMEKLRVEQLVAFKSLYGSISETGRALNYWKSLKYISESHDEKFIREAIRVAEGDIDRISEALKTIKDPVEQYKWLRDNQKLGIGEAFRTYVYGNMLSGIRTHERNFIGNTARVVFDLASEGLRHPTAAAYKTLGMAAAIPRAAKEFVFQMKNGFASEAAIFGQFDTIHPELPGGGLNPWNDVLRLLGASDTFTKALIKNGELYQRAFKEALKEGHRGQALFERAAQLRAEPPVQWLEDANKVAVNTVFQDPLGRVSGSIANMINHLRIKIPGTSVDAPVGWMVVPFVKIASNITKAGFEASPVGFLMSATRQGGRLGELARARAALGSLLLVPIGYMAEQGLISGSGPRDPAKRALLMQTGWRPNSIKIGDSWWDYSTWQPISVPLSAVANFADSVRELKAEGKDINVEQAALGMVLRMGNSLLNQSFLQGLYNLLEAMSEPEGTNISQLMTGHVQQLVPFSGALRNVTQAVDPVIRTPTTPAEAVKAIIPGMSEDVEPLLTPYGTPTIRTGTNPLLSGLFNRSEEVQDPVTNMLLSLDEPLARPSKRLEDRKGEPIQLTPEEQTALGMARGFRKRKNLERVAQHSGSPEQMRDRIEKAKREGQSNVTRRARMQKRRGEKLSAEKLLSRRYLDELYEKYLSR